MKWGILGAANIARKAVIPAIQRAGADVVAIASRSGSAEEMAEEFGIPKSYGSYEELLNDQEIEAVYIPVPNHLHKQWTITAAEAGKHILCEKPAALTHDDTKQMLESCKENNVYFLEAFMYQFHPQHERVKELIIAGEIGQVQFMKASFSFLFDKSTNNIRLEADKGGGALWDVGCYGIHSSMKILQSTPKTAQGLLHMDQKHQVDTTTFVQLEMENGTMAQIDCSFDAPMRQAYEVIGTNGTIKVPRAYRPDKDDHEGLIQLENQNGAYEEKVYGDQYKLQIETLEHAIANNESLEKYHELTLENSRILEELYRT
ncbi:Gfo/Idh/MocA family protein [Pontibacillus salicampi]|uniref:Gfo/Idh/MocA family protein n=1 Tax=Pontibacillus salicampi TaxID=1449801 RepID=A0ABV6LPG5_9BACI